MGIATVTLVPPSQPVSVPAFPSVFARACHGCGQTGPPLCARCRRHLGSPPTTRIRRAGPVHALFAYEGVGAALVRSLKFGDGRLLVTAFADDLAALVEDRVGDVSAVSWLPTSARRRRARGFDQAELLAKAVGRRLDVPVRRVLRRQPGPPQTGRTWEQRLANVQFSVQVRTARRLAGPIALIDDVCTTGATVRSAAESLRGHIAGATHFFTVARTP